MTLDWICYLEPLLIVSFLAKYSILHCGNLRHIYKLEYQRSGIFFCKYLAECKLEFKPRRSNCIACKLAIVSTFTGLSCLIFSC